MAGPKHLWAGDWESESARNASSAPARELPAPARPPAPPAQPSPAPVRPPFAARLAATIAGAMTRLRPRRLRIGRAGLAIAIAALLVVGGAYAITSVQDSGSPPASVSQTAWLGVQLLASPKGAEVAGVTPGSPAQLAGLRPGDVITQIEGQPVVVPVNVVYVVQALTPGRTVQLQYVRGRETHSTDVKLAARPARVSSP